MNEYNLHMFNKQLSLGRQIGRKILILARDTCTDTCLAALELMASLPPLPTEGREYREYDKTRNLYKQIYATCASVIVRIISMNHSTGRHDPQNSFNYDVPPEPLEAAKKICLLPEAYRSEPIKSALRSPYDQVRRAATQCYCDLPRDVQFCGLFNEADRKEIRQVMQSM